MAKKKFLFPFAILILLFLIFCAPQEKDPRLLKKNIVLINPSAWSLNSFLYLVDNKIVDIDDVNWQVIYDSKSSDRYSGGQNLL